MIAENPGRKPLGYEIRIEDCPRRVRAIFNGVPIADSVQAKVLIEGRLPPVYYFPRADTRMDLLHATSQRTYCPFRGNASYWTVAVGERTAENAAWSYEDPYEEATAIKGYVAFYRERMDAVAEEGEAPAPPAVLSPATAANPLLGWLLREAPAAPSARDLVEQFARAVRGGGIPLWRLWLSIRTLHPQLIGTGFIWEDNGKGVQQNTLTREVLNDPRYLDSPVKAIFEGAGGFRRRLDVPAPQLDFPILRELLEQGVTDYVVMPLTFSGGRINGISLSTKRPGGFTTADLGHIYEVLPVLARIFEVHAMRRNAVNLLDVYLGKQSGAKVLDGMLRRGDGEDVHAVIWFSDLRDSTRLADSMSRRKFLRLLDDFFDCTAAAVLEHGGEVLRFIGDASLAIFPISEAKEGAADGSPQAVRACETALDAAHDAHRRREQPASTVGRAGARPRHWTARRRRALRQHWDGRTARVQRHRRCRQRSRADRGDVQDARRFAARVQRVRAPCSRAPAIARAARVARRGKRAGTLHSAVLSSLNPRAARDRPSSPAPRRWPREIPEAPVPTRRTAPASPRAAAARASRG